MFCRNCNILMKHVMRFEKGKAIELERCPRCNAESKERPLKYPTTKTEKVQTKKNSRAMIRRKDVLRLHNNNQRVAKA